MDITYHTLFTILPKPFIPASPSRSLRRRIELAQWDLVTRTLLESLIK